MVPKKVVDWKNDGVLTFRNEPLFLKKDIVELHTAERWRKE